ncbi:COMM domain-containing protein 2-like [Thrips palmi]|uniref:COMM domain-containing protein 2-like n=1 Tax=Thrips palmi TaxID=161013 RepID=A0A6P8YF97_THRPL|nr:COMM domain-containing protein 2-like [Thrips palmi]
MMFLLSEEHKSHLSVLLNQPPQLLQDFCRLALELLKRGHNLKLYSAAAQKLAVEVQVIQLAVEGLVQLLVKSRQHKLSGSDFRDVALASGFNEELESVLTEFYESNKETVDLALGTLAPSLPHYHNLEWRFDVQIASKALVKETIPTLTMKLGLEERPQLEDNPVRESLLLQTDPNNLKHIIQKLDEALVEASSQHSRRLQRIFK